MKVLFSLALMLSVFASSAHAEWYCRGGYYRGSCQGYVWRPAYRPHYGYRVPLYSRPHRYFW